MYNSNIQFEYKTFIYKYITEIAQGNGDTTGGRAGKREGGRERGSEGESKRERERDCMCVCACVYVCVCVRERERARKRERERERESRRALVLCSGSLSVPPSRSLPLSPILPHSFSHSLSPTLSLSLLAPSLVLTPLESRKTRETLEPSGPNTKGAKCAYSSPDTACPLTASSLSPAFT